MLVSASLAPETLLGWSPEQASFRETAARFAADVLAPSYKATEKSGVIAPAASRALR